MKPLISLLTVICVLFLNCVYSKDIDKPRFSFGVIADCQYCNIKVPREAKRQYSLSKNKLTECVEKFNQKNEMCREKLC